MFTGTFIGENNELGRDSFKDFILTLSESETIPRTVVFWNESVTTCTKDSGLINELNRLDKMGCKILVSYKALEKLQLQNDLKIGKLANNFDLIEALSKVQKVITF